MKQVLILVFLAIATMASSQSYYVKSWFLAEAANQPVPFETRFEVKRLTNQTTFPAAINGEKYLYPKYLPKLVVVQIKY